MRLVGASLAQADRALAKAGRQSWVSPDGPAAVAAAPTRPADLASGLPDHGRAGQWDVVIECRRELTERPTDEVCVRARVRARV